MIEFLSQYGLFLAKILTLIVGILITFSAIIAIVQKGRKQDGTLVITNLNEKFIDIRDSIQEETLNKFELKHWLKSQKQESKQKKKAQKNAKDIRSRTFVVRFDGDIRAFEVTNLREIISAILQVSAPKDEVLVIVESSGGFVHGYGLAASQLDRIKQHHIKLTVAIDKLAASGGYLMACVADKIIAAPFAIVGSIGVIAQLPNFHRLLDKHNVDFEMHTAGEYKRTITMFGKNTDKGRKKFQEEIEQTHELFKQFITAHRPQVNIAEVATGEHWHAITALQYKLVDKIQTSDDFILHKIKDSNVFEISYEEKQKLSDRLSRNIFQSLETLLLKLFTRKSISAN